MPFPENELQLIQNGEEVEASVLNRHVRQLNNKLGKLQGVNTLNGSDIQDNSIPQGKLGINSVQNNNIQNDQVSTGKLQNSQVTEQKLQNESVTTNKVKDYSITNQKLQDNQINSRTIENKSIQGSKIQDNTLNLNSIEHVVSGSILGRPVEYDDDGEETITYGPVQMLSGYELLQAQGLGSQQSQDLFYGEDGEVLQIGSMNLGSFEEETLTVLLYRTEEELDTYQLRYYETIYDPQIGDPELEDGSPNPNYDPDYTGTINPDYDPNQEEPEYDEDFGDLKDLRQGFYQLGPNHSQNPLKDIQKEVTLIVTMHTEELQTFIQQSVESINGRPRLYIQNTFNSVGDINWVEAGQEYFAGSGLSIDGVTFSLPDISAQGTYGTNTKIPQVTINNKGLVTNIETVDIGGTIQYLVDDTIELTQGQTKDYNINTIQGQDINKYDVNGLMVDTRIKDTTQGSPTLNMFVNSEQVLVTAISENRNLVRIHNVRDIPVTQNIRITIGRV